jgi:copper chaperone
MVIMMKCELKVAGMRCNGCEMLVREALGELEGVQKVEASHQDGTVSVDFDPSLVGLETIKTVVEEQGFIIRD